MRPCLRCLVVCIFYLVVVGGGRCCGKGVLLVVVLWADSDAFGCVDAEQVRVFYDEAMKAGGVDNGKPGLRPHYAAGYYAAFVRDPVCGVNFEVLCHTAGEEEGTGS